MKICMSWALLALFTLATSATAKIYLEERFGGERLGTFRCLRAQLLQMNIFHMTLSTAPIITTKACAARQRADDLGSW